MSGVAYTVIAAVKQALEDNLTALLTYMKGEVDYQLNDPTTPDFQSISLWFPVHQSVHPYAVISTPMEEQDASAEFSAVRYDFTVEISWILKDDTTDDIVKKMYLYADAIKEVMKKRWWFYGDEVPSDQDPIEFVYWDTLKTEFSNMPSEEGVYIIGGVTSFRVRTNLQAVQQPF